MCEHTLGRFDNKKYFVSLQVHEFVTNYTDSLTFRIPLPKVLSIDSLSFNYDYTIYESNSSGIATINFTSLYLDTTIMYCNFVTVNPYPDVVSHTTARVIGNVDGMQRDEYINNLSEIQYQCDLPWWTISMNLNTQIYLSVSHDNKTYADYAFDKFANQYTQRLEALIYRPSNMILNLNTFQSYIDGNYFLTVIGTDLSMDNVNSCQLNLQNDQILTGEVAYDGTRFNCTMMINIMYDPQEVEITFINSHSALILIYDNNLYTVTSSIDISLNLQEISTKMQNTLLQNSTVMFRNNLNLIDSQITITFDS